jgi:amidase
MLGVATRGLCVSDLKCFVPNTLQLDGADTGPLAGVRVAVKDLFAVRGHTSSFGHSRWRETHSPSQATCDVIARLLGAGANVVGMAKMDQLAYSLIGNVGEGNAPVNEFAADCYCGGSSSGSASAVAGGTAELGLGTDTAGSIRVPAAACGLFSIRPTHGLISFRGVIPLAKTLDVVGLLARDPGLLSRSLAVLRVSPSRASRLKRVVIARDLNDTYGAATGDAVMSVAEAAARAIGGTTDDVELATYVNLDVGDLFARVQGREIWTEHADWIAANIDFLAGDVQTRLRRCEALSTDHADVIADDLAARDLYRQRVQALLGEDAVMVLPVAPRRGPLLDSSPDELQSFRRECFRLTAPSSLAGVPQVVLPTVNGPGGYVPVGLLAGIGTDRQLLALAEQLAGGESTI